jgi:hypothetical protein
MWEISGVGEEVEAGGGGEEGGGRWGLRGIGGGMTPHLGFGVHVLTICAQNLHESHKSSIFRRVGLLGGVCIFLEIDRVSSSLLENYLARSRPSLCEI